MSKLRVTRTRSSISRIDAQIQTLKRLGLHRMNQSVELDDTPVIRGMIKRVEHMVTVAPVKD